MLGAGATQAGDGVPHGVTLRACGGVSAVVAAAVLLGLLLRGWANSHWLAAWPTWTAGLALALAYLWIRLRPMDTALEVLRRGQKPSRQQARAAARALDAPVVFLVVPVVIGALSAAWALVTAGRDEAALTAAGVLVPCLAIGLVASLGVQRLVQPAIAALGFVQVPVGWRFGLRPRVVISSSAVAAMCCGVVVLLIGAAVQDSDLSLAWRSRGQAGTAVAAGFVCLVAGLAGGLFATGMHRRVGVLTRRLERMAVRSDVRPAELPVASTTEVGAIAAAYNRLVESLDDERRLLARHTDKVQHAERVRAKFLRTMSHELRTPLNSIIGFSDLLQRQFDGPLNERQREAVEVISRSGERLLEMINDILMMAQFEADRAVLDTRPTPMAELVEAAVAQAGGPVAVHWAADCRTLVAEVDGPMLTRAVAALVAHAAAGQDPVDNDLRIFRGDDGELRLSIRGWRGDCSEDEIGRLMDGFRRLGLSGRNPVATIDLGLPLARAIARLHGGELDFTATSGDCRVELILPADRLAPKEES